MQALLRNAASTSGAGTERRAPTSLDDRNTFLAELSARDYELFRPHLTSFSLQVGQQLQEFGRAIEYVVFPHSGVVAMTIPLRAGGGAAILMGHDSLVGGFAAAAAMPALCDADVYIAGRAAQMSASAFRNILDRSPTIRRLAARCTAALMLQLHQTALCNAVHPVEARVSRLLLEILDRSGSFDVPLTQSTLAQMLAALLVPAFDGVTANNTCGRKTFLPCDLP